MVQRRQDRDLRFFVPLIAELSEQQYRLVLIVQAQIVKHAQNAVPALIDQDVADAAAAVAGTLETARKGIIYEHQATSIPAQRLVNELRASLEELSREAGPAAQIERNAAVVLRQIEHGARTAAAALPEDTPPVFLSLMRRLMSRAIEPHPGEARSAPESPGGRIIIPG